MIDDTVTHECEQILGSEDRRIERIESVFGTSFWVFQIKTFSLPITEITIRYCPFCGLQLSKGEMK
jgi:hypothetical protein